MSRTFDPSDGARTLSEACGPFFVYLTSFRRNAATSSLGIEGLQAALKRELDRLRSHCEKDRRLHPLFERVWYALVATADQAVLGSAWPNRAGWSMNLLETHYFRTAESGTKFFQLAQDALNDSTEAGAEVAEVLFQCMALGFQGELYGERRELDRRRTQLFEKARLAGVLGESICPEAYNKNATRNLSKLPTVGTLRLAAVALVSILFSIAVGTLAARTADDYQIDQERVDELLNALDGEPR